MQSRWSNRFDRARAVLAAFALAATALVASGQPANAAAVWSWTPNPFACNAKTNSCVSGIGFDPMKSNWSMATNPRGNCTNYAAFRLAKNGASNFNPSQQGDAWRWKQNAIAKYGSKVANGTPAVGAVAWYDKVGAMAPYGHVAYVEKVSSDAKQIWVTESSFDIGSSRKVITKGAWDWPDAFLHVKDAPVTSTPYYSAQLTRSTPAGHTRDADITFKFSVKNPTKKDVKTKSMHVVIRDAKGKSHNAAWKTNYTMKAGKTTTVSVKKRFPAVGTYRAWPTWLGTDGKYHDGNVVTFDIWQPTITSGKWYTMTNRSSGMLVDVAGAKTANGTRVQQVKANGNRAQKWKFIATSDGYFKVMTGVDQSKGMDVKGGSKSKKAAIQIWTVQSANSVAGRNQQWKPVWTAGGGFVLIPRHATGMRLDVPDGKAKDGLKLQLWSAATGNLNQRFNIWETTY